MVYLVYLVYLLKMVDLSMAMLVTTRWYMLSMEPHEP